jgi:hypothetical protein
LSSFRAVLCPRLTNTAAGLGDIVLVSRLGTAMCVLCSRKNSETPSQLLALHTSPRCRGNFLVEERGGETEALRQYGYLYVAELFTQTWHR